MITWLIVMDVLDFVQPVTVKNIWLMFSLPAICVVSKVVQQHPECHRFKQVLN